MSPTVNLQSVDAMFARILIETKQLKALAEETRDAVATNSKRIDDLEGAQTVSKSRIAGAVAALSFVVGAIGFAVQHGLGRFFRS